MQMPKDQIATQFPHQLTRDEFISWWNQVNPETEPQVALTPASDEVIYLGQDPLQEA